MPLMRYLLIVALLMCGPARATPESDFAARCAAAGVVLCEGFETSAAINDYLQTAGDATTQGVRDTTTRSSGNSSLRFTLRSGVSDQNIGGAWAKAIGHTFNVGDTMYIQYRIRMSPAYFSNNTNYWHSTIKHINVHGSSSTCQGAEYTTVYNQGGRVDMYNNCGDGFATQIGANVQGPCGGGDCLIQQGANHTASPSGSGYNCRYQNQVQGIGDGDGCFWTTTGYKWYTIYEKIFIGTFGGSTSTVDAYVAVNGGAYKQFHRVTGVFFNNNIDNFFDQVRMETYMTEIAGSAPTTAYVWYDELIMSTQPIAAPDNGGKPSTVLNPRVTQLQDFLQFRLADLRTLQPYI